MTNWIKEELRSWKGEIPGERSLYWGTISGSWSFSWPWSSCRKWPMWWHRSWFKGFPSSCFRSSWFVRWFWCWSGRYRNRSWLKNSSIRWFWGKSGCSYRTRSWFKSSSKSWLCRWFWNWSRNWFRRRIFIRCSILRI